MSDNRKFVIFDLDGTLIDSYECVLRCVNKVLLSKGIASLDSATESIGNLFKRIYSEIEITPKEFKELFDKEHYNDTDGINVIVENCDILRRYYNNGIHIVILTNKLQCIAELICEKLLHEFYDDLKIIGRDSSTPLKEFPEKVLRRFSENNFSIHSCLNYYGNSETDFELSKKLQIPFVKI